MKKTALIAVAALLLILGFMSVSRVPDGRVGVAGEGDGARILQPGLTLRNPLGPSPALYSLELGPVAGEAPLKTADGRLYQISFEISGRLAPERALEFHRQAAVHGASKVLTQGAAHGISAAGASLGPAEVAGGGLQPDALRNASFLLEKVGVTGVALELRLDSPPTLLRLARALAPDALAGLVRKSAEAAIAADPESWESHAALGLVLESERDPRGAEEKYLDALALNATALEPMAQLVGIYTAVGEQERLERLLAAALKSEPGSIQHHNWLGASYLRRGAHELAEQIFRAALEREPGNSVILNNLGGVYLKQDRGNEALELFRRAVEVSPGDRQSLYNLGIGLCSRGEYPEGLEHLLSADEVAPGREAIQTAIAQAYRAMGRRSEAQEWEIRARESAGGDG